MHSLSVASGPSVEVGEGGGGSITRGNGMRDCDEVRKRMEERGGKTIEVELLEWTITHHNGSEGEQDHMTCSQHPECVKLIESIKP